MASSRVDGLSNLGPVAWLRRHPSVQDALAAVVVAAVAAVSAGSPVEGVEYEPWDATGVALAAVAIASLVLRRRYPVTVFVLVALATGVSSVLGYNPSPSALAALVALYTVAAYRERRVAATVFGLFFGVLLAIVVLDRADAGGADYLANTIVFGSAWLLGDNIRIRRQYVAELEEKAERLERDREEDARRAVLDERARIARELHDVVAHHVSVMVVQAGAARRVMAKDPTGATESLAVVEQTGRDALTEMRRMLGVLRAGEGEAEGLAPQPGSDDLVRLVDQVREAGLPVVLEVTGTAPPDPAVSLTVYRIVQEALTNSLRHAGRADARVRVQYEPDVVRVEVSDDGRGLGADPAQAGHGLVGMRERVALFGGDLHAGPRVGGGFVVRATLPRARADA